MRTMFKRRWLWATTLLAAVVGVGYLLVPVRESRITQANCDRIQLGWTCEQVNALLGESLGGVNRGGSLLLLDEEGKGDIDISFLWADDDENAIEVLFRGEWRVASKRYTVSTLSLAERVRRRIERRIKMLWRGS